MRWMLAVLLFLSPVFPGHAQDAATDTVSTQSIFSKPLRDSSHGRYRPPIFEAFRVPDFQVDEAYFGKLKEEANSLKSILKNRRRPNDRAEVLFRLGDLYWLYDKGRYLRKMGKYEQDFDAWTAGKTKKKPVLPKFSGRRSLRIYKRILKLAPKYHLLDEVLFRTGYSALEMGDPVSFTYFNRLVKEYPNSRFHLDALMQIAEHYFGKRRFDQAIATFKRVLKEPSKIYNLALYKLSWCYYNQGKIRPAMKIMQRVVRASKGVKHEIGLREEALSDLVLFYSDLGLVDEALQYFVSIGEPKYGIKVLRKLADIYFEQDRYAKAIVTVRKLLQISPFEEDAPNYHSRLIECYEKSRKLDRAINEMERFILTYQNGSPWHQRNTDADAREYAYERSEVYARYIAKKYHEQGQKLARTNPSASKRKLRLAGAYYQKYLEQFSDHSNAYNMRFLYAELLFKVKRFSASADQYHRVADADKKGKHRMAALLGKIDALTRLEENYFKTLRKKGIKDKNKFEPIPLSLYAQKLVETDQTYVKSFPKETNVPGTLLHRAQIFYNYNQLKKAKPAFFSLIKAFPNTPSADTARHLVLDILNIKKDWLELEKWASTFLKNKRFATNQNRQFLLKLIQGAIFQRAKQLEEKKEYAAAATTYMGLTNKYPDSPYADKALFNATINYISDDDSEKAIWTAKRFLRHYPKSKIVPKMLLALATYFDDKLDYAHAAQYYELLAEKDPGSKAASDALFNAGLYRENLGHYRKALIDYQTYLKRYPKKKDAPDIFFSMGNIYEKQKTWKDAAVTFKAFPRRYPHKKEKVVQSYYQQAQALEKLRQTSAAEKAYRTAVFLYRKYNKGRSGQIIGGKPAAKSHFKLIQKDLAEFESIKFRMPQRILARLIERKAVLLKRLKDRYLEVINYGDAEMGVAALYKIGTVYQDFAESLFNAPVPKGLTQEEVMLYQQELQNRAAPIEEKAVEAYEKAVKKAFELEVYTKWSKKAYDRLTQFKPDVYPPIRGYTQLTPEISEPIAPYKAVAKGGSK